MLINNLLVLKKPSFWIALSWTLLIFYLCLKPATIEKNVTFVNADKLIHFTLYFVFVILWYRFLIYRESFLLQNKILLVIVSIIVGILIEILQKYFTKSRHADFFDVLANSLGSMAGILFAIRYFRKIK
ncbi:VanZ family protein [Flavobacterium sp.]|uniref:VanZ family protein n=1 Tax=Flavobacterium sp. TaxID=239 RepID=UPI00286B38FB|nr:VanZ family protein [Flavobacterium sp.]